VNIQIKGLGSVIIYMAIGFLVYMLLYAPDVFAWSDPWIYIIAALWPFALIWEFLVIIFWIALAVGVVILICYLYDYFRNR